MTVQTHSKSQETRPIVLFDIDYTLFNTAHLLSTNLTEFLLYDEVITVLKKLLPIAKLGILSEGTLDWQLKKLKETQIHHIFDEQHMHIVEKKFEVAEKILSKYTSSDSVYLVDDKLTFLYQAKNILSSLCTIWIKRGFYAEKQEPIVGFTPDYTIYNLDEMIPIIVNDRNNS